MNSTDIQWSAILSWGYADNILRLKSKQSEPPINFIQSAPQYQVSCSQIQRPVPAGSCCCWAPAWSRGLQTPRISGRRVIAQLSPRARCVDRVGVAFTSSRPPAFCPVRPPHLALPRWT